MTQWAPFLWLTGVVLVLLLVLARLSSAVVRDGSPADAPVGPNPRGPSDSPTRAPDEQRHESSSPTPVDTEADTSTPTESVSARRDAPGEPAAATGEGESKLDQPAASAPAGDDRQAEADRGVSLDGRPVPAEEDRVELSTGMLLANVALTQGLVGLALVAGLVWFEIPAAALGLTADPWIGGPPAVGLGLAFGAALWLGNEVTAGVADAVGATYDEAVRGMLAPNSAVGWAVLLGIVLPTVAVVEELLFRGALVGVPAAGFGVSPWLLALVSSVAFALGHGAQGRVGIVVTGLLGFVLAAGYVLSGSLVVVIVAHYVVNAAEFVIHEGLGVGRLVG